MKQRNTSFVSSVIVGAACALLLVLFACGGSTKPPSDPGGDQTACTYGDAEYAPGQSFPAKDGCNTCTCGNDGMVQCTEKACGAACDPASEPKRRYIGNSADECSRIRFACEAGTTYFANECGCGCESP